MTERALLFLVFFAWSLGVTPLSIYISRQFRILDEPGGRKTHSVVTPRGAGIVIWLGYMLYSLFLAEPGDGLRVIFTGATAVFVVGYIDDMKSIPAAWRLTIHSLSAFLVVFFIPVPIPLKFIIFLWITGSTSAYNLIDGINGLSLSIFALTSAAGLYLTGSLWWITVLGLSSGMFFWNYPFAKTFLGDGGSTLLGFICMSQFSFELPGLLGTTSVFRWFMVMALIGGIPALDTIYSFSRRVMRGRSPFKPDRGHFHYILCDKGVPVSLVLLTLMIIHSIFLFFAITLIGI